MNAIQGKVLLDTAKRALRMLDPEWPIAADLRAAIFQASTIIPAKPKANGAVNQRKAWIALAKAEYDAWIKAGESVSDFHKRVVARFLTGKASQNIANGNGFDKETALVRLSLCACGHRAERHEKDELENLLICLDCDTCDHFHYEVDARQDEAA